MTSFTNVTTNYPQEANTPIRRVKKYGPPTATTIKNFILGDEWLDESASPNGEWWKLSNKATGGLVWTKIGGGVGQTETLTGNSGGAVPPDGGSNINVVGDATTIDIVGVPATNTLTVSAKGILASNYVTDSGSAIPAAGILQVLGGNGISTSGATNVITIDLDAPVSIANGGTNATTMATTDGTVYFDGTRLVTTATGNATQVLTSNGAGFAPTYQSLPTDQGFKSIVVQTFTGNGTYTPTAGMQYCTIEVVGGGGGGGGGSTCGATQASGGGSGGGGGYARKTVAAATIGVSQSVGVGAAGAAGAAGANNGGTGGTSSLGSIVSATGGAGGEGKVAGATFTAGGGLGGVGASGDFNAHGGAGDLAFGYGTVPIGGISGSGGNSIFGGGARGSVAGGSMPGEAGTTYGGGGSGAAVSESSSEAAGGAGAAGIVIVTEFIG